MLARRFVCAPTPAELPAGAPAGPRASQGLLSSRRQTNVIIMGLPNESVSLTPAEVEALNLKLSELRHNVNNHLTLMTTAIELMRRKPDSIPRMVTNLVEQPHKIRDDLISFSQEFEQSLHITRD